MDENFAFSKKSDLRKSILGRSDFFGFFDFSLSMQICYSPFRYVLSIFNYSQEAWQQELKYKSKIAKNLWNITNQHIFSCWTQIWPSFINNHLASLSKISFFAIFLINYPFLLFLANYRVPFEFFTWSQRELSWNHSLKKIHGPN